MEPSKVWPRRPRSPDPVSRVSATREPLGKSDEPVASPADCWPTVTVEGKNVGTTRSLVTEDLDRVEAFVREEGIDVPLLPHLFGSSPHTAATALVVVGQAHVAVATWA